MPIVTVLILKNVLVPKNKKYQKKKKHFYSITGRAEVCLLVQLIFKVQKNEEKVWLPEAISEYRKNTSLSDDISNLNEDITPSNSVENSSDKK